MGNIWRAFNTVIPIFISTIPMVVAWGYLAYKTKRRDEPLTAFKRVSIDILLLLTVIGILMVTLSPQQGDSSINLIPFISSYYLVTRAIDVSIPLYILGFNILLFIPFGFFYAWKSDLLWKTVLIGGILSVFIETTQFLLVSGRATHIDDVILNTLGTFIGASLFFIVRYYMLNRSKSA